jgi:hypothetical protein
MKLFVVGMRLVRDGLLMTPSRTVAAAGSSNRYPQSDSKDQVAEWLRSGLQSR